MKLHGEHKTPGGKLVVVDLDVKDGVLHGVEVSGDFFLEPAEALEDIVRALEGAPSSDSEEELAARIQARLRPDAALIGFDPESVAVAVRRAVTDGSPRERA
jgi:lipoate-protein ligase A